MTLSRVVRSTRVGPEPPSAWDRLAELIAARELLFFFVWRDISVRYKQTLLGVAWAVLQPVLTMLIFSVVFGRLARMPSDGVPYPLFALCGLVPWQLFVYSLNNASASLVSNERLVTRAYFSRLTLPLASVCAGLVDFVLAFLALLFVLAAYGEPLTWRLAIVPVITLEALAAASAAGIGLAALNVRYRDVKHALPFLGQILLFVTPIAYPSSLVPGRWRPLLGINPMAGVVESFRWALLPGSPAPGSLAAVSALAALIGCGGSLWYFIRVERSFADVI